MASRTIFDPLTALRLTPVVSATVSLWFARDEHLFLSILTDPAVGSHGNSILPAYFKKFFTPGLATVLSFLTITTSTSIIAARGSPGGISKSGGPGLWYAAGAAFAASHLLWIPFVAPKIEAIINNKNEPEGSGNVEEMKAWLRVNAARALTSDLATWICCVGAALQVFGPRV